MIPAYPPKEGQWPGVSGDRHRGAEWSQQDTELLTQAAVELGWWSGRCRSGEVTSDLGDNHLATERRDIEHMGWTN